MYSRFIFLQYLSKLQCSEYEVPVRSNTKCHCDWLEFGTSFGVLVHIQEAGSVNCNTKYNIPVLGRF